MSITGIFYDKAAGLSMKELIRSAYLENPENTHIEIDINLGKMKDWAIRCLSSHEVASDLRAYLSDLRARQETWPDTLTLDSKRHLFSGEQLEELDSKIRTLEDKRAKLREKYIVYASLGEKDGQVKIIIRPRKGEETPIDLQKPLLEKYTGQRQTQSKQGAQTTFEF